LSKFSLAYRETLADKGAANRTKLNFLFVKILFSMNVKGQRNPSWQRSSQEGLKKYS